MPTYLKLSWIPVLLLCGHARAATIYRVYEGPTLEYQFTTAVPISPATVLTDFTNNLGPTNYFSAPGSVLLGTVQVNHTRVNPWSLVNAIGDTIQIRHVDRLVLQFAGPIPTAPGSYDLVPGTIASGKSGIFAVGSYGQVGVSINGFDATAVITSGVLVLLDRVVISEAPEPGGLIMAVSILALCPFVRRKPCPPI